MHKNPFSFSVIIAMALLFTVNLAAQTSPEVIKNWTALEEAEFHFDVSYSIVKCSPNSKAVVLLNAFNEDGTNPKVGFTLNFSDDNGNTAVVKITPFKTKLGDMFIASCDSSKYSNLKFDYPEKIDLKTMKIEITYQTGL
ncbi:hypothetical protein [Pseudotenacibaculum haliotis]|uniref:Uncharacterized protein n=1 Tax=Pseudotenacibaculum haliotis TaxID=1862138 RepID=A0ABW5LN85_9FLAO